MKIICCFLLGTFLCGCGGGLSEKKREAIKEEMKAREIKRVPEEDIVAAAFKDGKAIYKQHKSGSDSLLHAFKAKIYFVGPEDTLSDPKESELMEAYQYSAANDISSLADNVQRDREEMIYSVPKLDSGNFKGIYIIRIPRKQIVLSL